MYVYIYVESKIYELYVLNCFNYFLTYTLRQNISKVRQEKMC